MPPFDFEAARRRIAEYESRTEPEERRGPIWLYESKEPEGWSKTLKAELQKTRRYKVGLTKAQLLSMRNTEMSAKQKSYHDENDETITEAEIVEDEDGRVLFIYIPHGFTILWGSKVAEEMLSKFAADMEEFRAHFPPGPPKHADKRFRTSYEAIPNYEKDKARCEPYGYDCGVHHLGYRRENGNPQQIPAISTETIESKNKFRAVDKFYQDVTPIKQSLGMLYWITCPDAYGKSTEIVENWSKKTVFGGLVHTEREFSTLTVMNTNLTVVPHRDPGDFPDIMTAMHAWGDFDRGEGGELCIPILAKRYVMYDDAVVFMRASELVHYVRPVQEGEQRFSMVHATTKDMAKFDAVQLPPTPAEKSARQLAAKPVDDLTECPFCRKAYKGSSVVNGHLTRIIKKGGDDEHDVEEITQWRDTSMANTLKARRARGGKREFEDVDEDGDEGESDGVEEDEEEEEEGAAPRTKRPKTTAERVKPFPVSHKYERYGQALFGENARNASN